MDTTTMQLIVTNGHFMGYDLKHKKKVRKTVMQAQAMAEKIYARRGSTEYGHSQNLAGVEI